MTSNQFKPKDFIYGEMSPYGYKQVPRKGIVSERCSVSCDNLHVFLPGLNKRVNMGSGSSYSNFELVSRKLLVL